MRDDASLRHTSDPQIPPLEQLSLRSARDGDVHTISVAGELDLSTAADVEEELVAVERTGVATILLDLSGLQFMDTSGIRLLLTADARARANGNRLTLRRPPGNVMRVLTIAGIADRLPFVD
jgi:anti-sigma B factor antagonist